MTKLIKLEELAMFLFAGFLFFETDFDWWLFPALLLLPDLSMAGYLINSTIGASCYNLVHHRGIAVGILVVGWYLNDPYFELTGIILFAHSSIDRLLGYGLKFRDSFKHTHLGYIGDKKDFS